MRPPTDDPAISPGAALLDRVRLLLDLPPAEGAPDAHAAVPLPSRLATDELAWASVASAMLSAGRSPAAIDPHRAATAYRSDRVLAIDGVAPPVWSPHSGFWRTADGWIRTHGNYPHHATALCAALGVHDDADADAVRAALHERATAEAVAAVTRAGGLAVAVTAEDPAIDRALRDAPLLDVRHITGPTPRYRRPERAMPTHDDRLPLAGMRVLDLTRVIAGPVCTRTLALLGADVLRIDPPHLPEPEWQHLDTGHGKRSARLDARTPQMHELLAAADAVVLGYRPAALDRLGLNPSVLAERYPGLVVAQLSAWGTEHPDRAGFDSLVQAASGIALVESPDGDRPGTLPAQALDHSAGYLLAAAVTTQLLRRAREGGSWYTGTSLRRIAAELLGMPRRREPEDDVEFDVGPHLARFEVDGRSLVTARPAMTGLEFGAPHPWGSDQPIW
ncbi:MULTISPECIES: CoA transferase [unclassified Microbacterium]|uniref:CoA transferase n=1 Tax=unclassified Microbacterium TaxID=2609290 RepID=UPI00109C5EB1|nr:MULTISPECIES: CoA transferase [unclassified Microbacterium]